MKVLPFTKGKHDPSLALALQTLNLPRPTPFCILHQRWCVTLGYVEIVVDHYREDFVGLLGSLDKPVDITNPTDPFVGLFRDGSADKAFSHIVEKGGETVVIINHFLNWILRALKAHPTFQLQPA